MTRGCDEQNNNGAIHIIEYYSMDRILQIFKEYDIDVLLAKKALVSSELKKNKELQDKLEKMMERIEKEIEIVRNMEYESD